MRLRAFAALTGSAAAALLLADACAAPVGSAVTGMGELLDAGGELLRDGGAALVEAGSAMRDGARDASAQSAGPARSGSRIEMRVAKKAGADGSVYTVPPAPFDTMRNETCYPRRASDGLVRCLPSYGGPSGYFADAGCSQRTVGKTPCDQSNFAVETVVPGATCGEFSYRVWALGAKLASAFIGKPGSCTPYVIPEGIEFFALGAEIPATSFVEFKDDGFDTLSK